MRARKRFGQHFLDASWSSRVLEAAAFAASDQVIEIGPGRGALTIALARSVAALTAVEIDRDLVPVLRGRLPPHARVIEADFLDLPADVLFGRDIPGPWRVIGNLPYNVSSPILFRLLDLARSSGRLRDATLMLQREVADRVASPPGSRSYGALSILVQLDADVEPLLTLPPGAFRPAPEVWSSRHPPALQAPEGPGGGPAPLRSAGAQPVLSAPEDAGQRAPAGRLVAEPARGGPAPRGGGRSRQATRDAAS